MAEADGPKLTILTPVYNRADFLPRLFACLQKQTSKDFEWIIIDDGSTDNSLKVANSFADERFHIQVLSKPNGGKHTALNYSHAYIHGKFVLILDSDDILVPNAVKIIEEKWKKYQDNFNIGMLIFLKGKDENTPFCIVKKYNQPVDFVSCPRTYILGRDCCEVIRSSLFKQFPFPEFPGEKFIGESALWYRASKIHSCVYINQVVYLCEYLPGGLTLRGRAMRLENPLGGMYVANLKLINKNTLKERLKYGVLYTCYGKFANRTWHEMKKECSYKWIFYITFLGGVFLYFYWKKKLLN